MNAKFSDKLELILKVLVLSRSGLASELNVDKSLVGRWVSGTVKPSEYNLAKLTRFIASRVEGFTLLDWEKDLNSLEMRLGVGHTPPVTGASRGLDVFPGEFLEDSERNTKKRAWAYEGIWKSTRASNDLPGRFAHDICMLKLDKDGILRTYIGVEGVRFEGSVFMLMPQLYSISYDKNLSIVLFSIYNGVVRSRPEVLDGLNLTTLRDAGGSPAASASVMHRIYDLTGNDDQDFELFETLVSELNWLAPEGSISPDIAEHLTRKVQDGSPGVMRLLLGNSLSRGSILSS